MPGMAHMAGNEPNFDISSKKYDVKKSVPQKCKTAWALGLNAKNLSKQKKTFMLSGCLFLKDHLFSTRDL